MGRKKVKERWIGHYRSSQQILLVGEGDFSFSACLAKAFGSANNMVATSLDSRCTLLTKYRVSCLPNLKELKKRGGLVLHEVDVHDMNQHPILKDMKFDVIVFNFPHAGHVKLHETNPIIIQMHKKLLRGFFRSGSEMLKDGGEIHVAHRDDKPYSKWNLETLAQNAGLDLKEKVSFVKELYPGYQNKRGGAIRGHETFPLKDTFTFKFSLDHHQETTLSYTTTTTRSDHDLFQRLKSVLSKKRH